MSRCPFNMLIHCRHGCKSLQSHSKSFLAWDEDCDRELQHATHPRWSTQALLKPRRTPPRPNLTLGGTNFSEDSWAESLSTSVSVDSTLASVGTTFSVLTSDGAGVFTLLSMESRDPSLFESESLLDV